MDEILRHDENTIRVLGGITDDANQYIRMLRVDPTTGRLLVSGTGSSGSGFQLPLSGGLSGTNTWSTAPNAIVVDGSVLQKVDQNGDVNWTGTTTTLLTNIPTRGIFAIA